jgi:hypothetical protein
VNARLPTEDARKLSRLAKAEGKSVSDIIREALRRYYADAAGGSAAEILKRNGFIGCATGPANLSTTYKRELAKSLATKHGHR